MRGILVLPPDSEAKLKVLHAVDRPFKDLSVDMLCEKCGISKKTFYKLFDSKYDIPYWYYDISRNLFLNNIGRSLNWHHGLLEHFQFVYAEKEIFFRQTEDGVKPDLMYREEVLRKQALLKTLTDYKGITANKAVTFLVDAYVSLEMHCFIGWCKTKMAIPPLEFLELFIPCIPSNLFQLLDDVDESPDNREVSFLDKNDHFIS